MPPRKGSITVRRRAGAGLFKSGVFLMCDATRRSSWIGYQLGVLIIVLDSCAFGAGKEELRKAARWPFCSETLPQIGADYNVSAYFRDDHGIFVNLHIAPACVGHRSRRCHLDTGR